jgi:hypothetical protein
VDYSDRLADYQEDLERYTAILGELDKLDVDTLTVNAGQLVNAAVQIGVKNVVELIENVKWAVDVTKERIAGIQAHVRAQRQREEAYQHREYEQSV